MIRKGCIISPVNWLFCKWSILGHLCCFCWQRQLDTGIVAEQKEVTCIVPISLLWCCTSTASLVFFWFFFSVRNKSVWHQFSRRLFALIISFLLLWLIITVTEWMVPSVSKSDPNTAGVGSLKPVVYHWWELPQVFMSRQTGVCLWWEKYACCDKTFVTTKFCLSYFVATKLLLWQIFVVSNTCLSRQNFCCNKNNKIDHHPATCTHPSQVHFDIYPSG